MGDKIKSITVAQGFTLLELLVCVAIVGILAAIAIPRYGKFKVLAFNARAEADLRSLAMSEELHYAEFEQYTDCADETCSDLEGFDRFSDGVSGSVTVSDDGGEFVATTAHAKGDAQYTWDSARGGAQPAEPRS